MRGFFDALDDDYAEEFQYFFNSYTVDELMDLLTVVADRYRLMPMEDDLIRGHLPSHGALLHETLLRRFNAH